MIHSHKEAKCEVWDCKGRLKQTPSNKTVCAVENEIIFLELFVFNLSWKERKSKVCLIRIFQWINQKASVSLHEPCQLHNLQFSMDLRKKWDVSLVGNFHHLLPKKKLSNLKWYWLGLLNHVVSSSRCSLMCIICYFLLLSVILAHFVMHLAHKGKKTNQETLLLEMVNELITYTVKKV